MRSIVVACAIAVGSVATGCSFDWSESQKSDVPDGGKRKPDAGDVPIGPESQDFAIGGMVTGLVGSGLVLENNGGDALSIAADGEFTFTTKLPKGQTYGVAVASQPSGPTQTCSISGGTGTVDGAVSNIAVTCSVNAYRIYLSVSGLSGTGLVLQNNGADALSVAGDGEYVFATPVASGSVYEVSVSEHPHSPAQYCRVNGASAVVEGEDARVRVECELNVLIAGDNGATGVEPFVSDGRAAGTRLLKDINTNTNSNPASLASAGGVIYFSATTMLGSELWKTNGTAAGTMLVKDINPDSNSSTPSCFVALGDAVYFSAETSDTGRELWRTDGTPQGTALVMDMNPGKGSGIAACPVVWDSLLYFPAQVPVPGSSPVSYTTEIWQSDGTASGTKRLRDAFPQIPLVQLYTDPLVVAHGRVWFWGFTKETGVEPWVLEKGSSISMRLLKDIKVGTGTSEVQGDLTPTPNGVYFTATDGTAERLWFSNPSGQVVTALAGYAEPIGYAYGTLLVSMEDSTRGRELWRVDGNQTTFVKELSPGVDSTVFGWGSGVVGAGKFHFSARVSGSSAYTVWQTDGTAAGTRELRAAASGKPVQTISKLFAGPRLLYFQSPDDGVHGSEVWKTDGTDQGTQLLRDLHPGPGSDMPRYGSLAALMNGDTFYFAGGDGVHGVDLWRTDGTADGTVLVADLGTPVSSNPSASLRMKGLRFFSADDGLSGSELYRTDGTPEGTTLVKRINADYANARAKVLTSTKDLVYFVASQPATGLELWRSDGTANGTAMVADAVRGADGFFNVDWGVALGSTLIFTAGEVSTEQELWRSDGTAEGTYRLKDIRFGSNGSSPSKPVVLGSVLYFLANDGTRGIELWRTDGTPEGTLMVRDGCRDACNGVSSLFAAKGALFGTTLGDAALGNELWRLDDPATLVKDIAAGNASADPMHFGLSGNILYFGAKTPTSAGHQLWRSDGSPEGTMLVRAMGNGTGINAAPTLVGQTLFFPADDGTGLGNELWVTDGTTAGTRRVKDIWPGASHGYRVNESSGVDTRRPSGMSIGKEFLFIANDGTSGNELWTSDGTESGTHIVTELNPGLSSGVTAFLE